MLEEEDVYIGQKHSSPFFLLAEMQYEDKTKGIIYHKDKFIIIAPITNLSQPFCLSMLCWGQVRCKDRYEKRVSS